MSITSKRKRSNMSRDARAHRPSMDVKVVAAIIRRFLLLVWFSSTSSSSSSSSLSSQPTSLSSWHTESALALASESSTDAAAAAAAAFEIARGGKRLRTVIESGNACGFSCCCFVGIVLSLMRSERRRHLREHLIHLSRKRSALNSTQPRGRCFGGKREVEH